MSSKYKALRDLSIAYGNGHILPAPVHPVDPIPPVIPDPVPGDIAFSRQTVISQYANSPIILQMVQDFTTYFDATADLNAFFDLVWNVDTAQGYGLDIWGRIVGIDRVLHVAADGFFGFDEATDGNPFGFGAFYNGSDSTSNYALSDTAYRQLIFAKALSNITDGSIPSINKILVSLFPQYKNCYVTDGQNMTMTYTFHGMLSPIDLAIISGSGVLPKPLGVSVTVVQL